MTAFRCKMTGPDGRIAEQTLTADSKAALKSRLESEGYYVHDILKEGGVTLFKKKQTGPRRIKTRDFFPLTRNFQS